MNFNAEDDNVEKIVRYRFKADNVFYFVDLYDFKNPFGTSFWGIKFYPKPLSNCKDKYKKILNKKWCIRSRKIISTVVYICRHHHLQHQYSSFVFYGERKCDEKNKTTKRFSVYSLFCAFLIDTDNFHHLVDESTSTYLLLNSFHDIKDRTLLPKIKSVFSDYFEAISSEENE